MQIYYTKLNDLAINSNFLAFFLYLFEKNSLLDTDHGGEINADPDPQTCFCDNGESMINGLKNFRMEIDADPGSGSALQRADPHHRSSPEPELSVQTEI